MLVTRLTGSHLLIVGMPMVLPNAMGATSAIHFARMHIAFRYASRPPCQANPTRHSASKERPGWPDYPGLLSRRHCFPMAVLDTSARCLGEVHNQEPFQPCTWGVCSFATSANHTQPDFLPPFRWELLQLTLPHSSNSFVYIYAHEWWHTPKPPTEWGTYSFSQLQHVPSPKSGTCNCISVQARRLFKKIVLADPPGVLIMEWKSFGGSQASFRSKGLQSYQPNSPKKKKNLIFDTQTSFRVKRLLPDKPKSEKNLSFWRSNLLSRQTVAAGPTKRAKTFSFWHSNLVSCARVAGPTKLARNPQFLTLEPRFVRKGCRRTNRTRKKPSIFNTWTSVRAEKWPYRRASSALPAGLREKKKKERERERDRETERQRDRETERQRRCEDVKMWVCEGKKMWRCEYVKVRRCEDVKMGRCEDVKMWTAREREREMCEDVQMWWFEDVKMWRWGDVKMWRWEDVKMWRCEYVNR